MVLFHHNIVRRTAKTMRERIGLASIIGGVEGSAMRAPDLQIDMTNRSETMKHHNTARATLLGTAAALLAATAGMAVADNAAPATPATTTAQPSQQQTGVTAPTEQPSATSVPASATTTATPAKTRPTRIWIKRAERGTRGSTKK